MPECFLYEAALIFCNLAFQDGRHLPLLKIAQGQILSRRPLNGKSEKGAFLARLDEVQKSLCTTPGVGVHIYVKASLMAYIFQII